MIRGDLSETDAELLVQIGFTLEKGTVFEQNYPAAISFYSAAAAAGNAQAINNIGWMLENGLGTKRNIEMPLKHLPSLHKKAIHVQWLTSETYTRMAL